MKRTTLALLLLVLVAVHLPILYGLYQSLQVRNYVSGLSPRAMPVPFQDIRGVFHVHSAWGGHSLGTCADIAAAARMADCQFVFMTEHAGPGEGSCPGEEGLVFISGREHQEEGKALLEDNLGRFQVGESATSAADLAGLDGMEIFNLHESARENDDWYRRLLAAYHQLFLTHLFPFHLWEPDIARLRLWDEILKQREITGVGGTDAHQNIGLILQTAAGQPVFRVQVDPYEESFRFVTTHVLLPQGASPTEDAILEALRRGAAYVAFEKIAPSDGFSFHAVEGGRRLPMGSQVGKQAALVLQAPLPSEFRLVHNGAVVQRMTGISFQIDDLKSGFYRVEIFPIDPPPLLASRPWIISNPIFVR